MGGHFPRRLNKRDEAPEAPAPAEKLCGGQGHGAALAAKSGSVLHWHPAALPPYACPLLVCCLRFPFCDAGVLMSAESSSALGMTFYRVPCRLPLYKCLLNTANVSW